jgi:hypothetical protein
MRHVKKGQEVCLDRTRSIERAEKVKQKGRDKRMGRKGHVIILHIIILNSKTQYRL